MPFSRGFVYENPAKIQKFTMGALKISISIRLAFAVLKKHIQKSGLDRGFSPVPLAGSRILKIPIGFGGSGVKPPL